MFKTILVPVDLSDLAVAAPALDAAVIRPVPPTVSVAAPSLPTMKFPSLPVCENVPPETVTLAMLASPLAAKNEPAVTVA